MMTTMTTTTTMATTTTTATTTPTMMTTGKPGGLEATNKHLLSQTN